MSEIEKTLAAMGMRLPAAKQPVANYLGSKQVGKVLYVSARVSQMKGKAGVDIDEEQASQASRDTMLDLWAIVKADIGDLDRIDSIVSVQGFINSGPSFTTQPMVMDGASNLLIALYGDKGRHARSATGVAQLPYGACVQINMVVELKSSSA